MKRKHLKVLLSTMGALIAMLALTASPAQAVEEPAPGYEDFAGCPSPEEDSTMEACLTSTVTGGHFQMGSKDVPITKPITLSGAISGVDGSFHYNSKGGLLPAKQEVPGGVVGITGLDWLVKFLGVDALKLYAVTELAGQPGNPFFDEPFPLPIKVHLVNPVLGNNCYVGSNSNPIQLKLSLGTTSPPPPNEPISGQSPEIVLDPTREGVFLSEGGTYVDNSFAAPAASGCVLTLLGFLPVNISGLVNTQAGLPSAAGTNETVQEFEGAVAYIPTVYP